MSWIEVRLSTERLVGQFFERNFAVRRADDGVIWARRSTPAWNECTSSYFIERRQASFRRDDFIFDWSDQTALRSRLLAEGHGARLTQDVLGDLLRLHNTLSSRALGPGTISDEIYVMF